MEYNIVSIPLMESNIYQYIANGILHYQLLMEYNIIKTSVMEHNIISIRTINGIFYYQYSINIITLI